MTDLDDTLHEHARLWSASAQEPPSLDAALRFALHDRHVRRRSLLMTAAAAAIVAAFAVAVMVAGHGRARPATQPAVTESHLPHSTTPRPPTEHTPTPKAVTAIKPFPRVTARPMTPTDLKRATYWGRKYVQISRATAAGAHLHTRLVHGGSWPKDVVLVEAIVVTIRDGGRLLDQKLTGGALPTSSNNVIVLHLVGRFTFDGMTRFVNGRPVPSHPIVRSIMATIGINGGQYDSVANLTDARSGSIPGATQLSP